MPFRYCISHFKATTCPTNDRVACAVCASAEPHVAHRGACREMCVAGDLAESLSLARKAWFWVWFFLDSIILQSLIYVSSVPFYYAFASHKLRSIFEAIAKAPRLGADCIPPIVKCHLPGNIDILMELERRCREDYCGSGSDYLFSKCGKGVHQVAVWYQRV